MKLDNVTAQKIAALAIAVDSSDKELFTYERDGARQAARDTRAKVDQLRMQLADAIAEVTR